MPGKIKHFHYFGNAWILIFWLIVFFPVALALLFMNAIWVEHDVSNEYLAKLFENPHDRPGT